jgi:hypothetical protein
MTLILIEVVHSKAVRGDLLGTETDHDDANHANQDETA